MPFDLNAARKAGYTDQEIGQFLAKKYGFDYSAAVKSGYSPSEIAGFLAQTGQQGKAGPSTGALSRTYGYVRKGYKYVTGEELPAAEQLGTVRGAAEAVLKPAAAAPELVGLLGLPKTWGKLLPPPSPEGRVPGYFERFMARHAPAYGPRGAAYQKRRLAKVGRLREFAAKASVKPEMVAQSVGPERLAALPLGFAAFPFQMALGAVETGARATGQMPHPQIATLGQMGREWVDPFVKAWKEKSLYPIIGYAINDPVQALIDISILYGVTKGTRTKISDLKEARRVRREVSERLADELVRQRKPPTHDRLKELLKEHGIPPESVDRAAELLDQVPAYLRRADIEIGPVGQAAPVPPEPLTPQPREPLPLPIPEPGRITELAAKAVRRELTPHEKTMRAAREALLPPRKTGIAKTAEEVLRERRAAPVRRLPKVEVRPDMIRRMVEEAYRPKRAEASILRKTGPRPRTIEVGKEVSAGPEYTRILPVGKNVPESAARLLPAAKPSPKSPGKPRQRPPRGPIFAERKVPRGMEAVGPIEAKKPARKPPEAVSAARKRMQEIITKKPVEGVPGKEQYVKRVKGQAALRKFLDVHKKVGTVALKNKPAEAVYYDPKNNRLLRLSGYPPEYKVYTVEPDMVDWLQNKVAVEAKKKISIPTKKPIGVVPEKREAAVSGKTPKPKKQGQSIPVFRRLVDVSNFIKNHPEDVYIRYTSSPTKDIKRGYSINWSNRSPESGLSALRIAKDDAGHPVALAFRITEYSHIRMSKGGSAYLVTGRRVGTDADGAPTIRDMKVVGRIAPSLIQKLADWARPYWKAYQESIRPGVNPETVKWPKAIEFEKERAKPKAAKKEKIPKTKKGIVATAVSKLKEEKGSIVINRRTKAEKRFAEAMRNYRKAVKAEEVQREARRAAQLAERATMGTKGGTRDAVLGAMGKSPQEAGKRLRKAVEEEFYTPEKFSPVSEASVQFIKTGSFEEYLKHMPTVGEVTPKELRGEAGVVDVRRSGHYVHTSFAQQFAEGAVKDIPRTWEQKLDPGRLFEWADRRFGGQLAKKILRPARDATRARLVWEAQWMKKLADIAQRHGVTSKRASRQLARYMLGEIETAPQNILAAARELRELYDTVLEQMNAAREARNQELIPRRKDYFPWMIEQTWRQRLFGERAKPEWIIEQTPAPDFIQPNKPFNPRELPRRADYESYVKQKDAIKVTVDYLRTAARDIFNTDVIHNNKVHAKFLSDLGYTNLSRAIMDWTTNVYAGREHWFDRNFGNVPVAAQAFRFQRGVKKRLMRAIFPLNFQWNLLIQPSSAATLLARVGTANAVKAMRVFVDPKLRRFVEQTYTHVMKSEANPEVAAFKPTAKEFKALERQSVGQTLADRLNFFTKWLEKNLTDHAIAAGYYEGKRLGLRGRDLLEFASDVGARVHSMYNYEDLPGLLRSKDISSSIPLQTFAFEMMNNLDEIARGRGVMSGLSRPQRAARLLKWYAGMMAFNALSEHYTGRSPWTITSFLPIIGPAIAYWLGLEGGRYNAMQPLLVQAITDFRKALRNYVYHEDLTATRQFITRWGGLPGGVALERVLATEEARHQGGAVKTATGRTLFRVPKGELGKSYLTGPWATSKAVERKRKRTERDVLERILGAKRPKPSRHSPSRGER